jgi:hypothetical protein
MTIEELGALGELIAAIATIATLLYLARQIRNSNITNRAQARRAIRADSSHTMQLIASDEDVARIFMSGLAHPESLSTADGLRFRFLLADLFAPVESAWREYTMGAGEYSDVSAQLRYSREIFRTPGARFWLEQNKELYDEELVALLRNEMRAVATSPGNDSVDESPAQ